MYLRVAAMLGRAVIVLLFLNVGSAHGQPVATAPTIHDFMVQNVCLDEAGAVRIGRSPIDEGGCAGQRDLLPGEALPYHKHDHPSPQDRRTAPSGYQRHDSFPVLTEGLGTVVEQSFDFGGGGRRFGAFDRGSDGGDVVNLLPRYLPWRGLDRRDRNRRRFRFMGRRMPRRRRAGCADAVMADPRIRSEPSGTDERRTVARLNAARLNADQGSPAECPTRLNPALTRWRVAPFIYRAGPGQGPPVTLNSLISDHYGGADPDTADHVERFYFTRELGGTRWERWQNVRGNRQFGAAEVARRAASFAATGRCSAAEPPRGRATMVLIDCREWTQIVPPADSAGDPPGFWIEAIRTRPEAPAFFLKPGSEKK